MTPETLYRMAPPLISLEFLAFCWSVNREIKAVDAEKQSVIPIPDLINILSLFATVGCLIVLPLATEAYLRLSRMVLGGAYVLLAFHPFMVAAHYRLWRRTETRGEARVGAKSAYANREELIVSLFALLIAAAAAACPSIRIGI